MSRDGSVPYSPTRGLLSVRFGSTSPHEFLQPEANVSVPLIHFITVRSELADNRADGLGVALFYMSRDI
jgi:hypothetical protein